MNKKERIVRYGEEAWQKKLEQMRQYNEAHPEQVKESNHSHGRKGGRNYQKEQKYKQTGLQGERNRIRRGDCRRWQPYKDIIAPESQIHHEWIPQTAEYRGIALVEADAHMHGFVDVIEILDGNITLLTEEEIRKGKKNGKAKQ